VSLIGQSQFFQQGPKVVKLEMADGPLYHDPWAKREAWRKTPQYFSRKAMFRQMFPGFGIALVAFSAYVVVDNVYLSTHSKKEEHHD